MSPVDVLLQTGALEIWLAQQLRSGFCDCEFIARIEVTLPRRPPCFLLGTLCAFPLSWTQMTFNPMSQINGWTGVRWGRTDTSSAIGNKIECLAAIVAEARGKEMKANVRILLYVHATLIAYALVCAGLDATRHFQNWLVPNFAVFCVVFLSGFAFPVLAGFLVGKSGYKHRQFLIALHVAMCIAQLF